MVTIKLLTDNEGGFCIESIVYLKYHLVGSALEISEVKTPLIAKLFPEYVTVTPEQSKTQPS